MLIAAFAGSKKDFKKYLEDSSKKIKGGNSYAK